MGRKVVLSGNQSKAKILFEKRWMPHPAAQRPRGPPSTAWMTQTSVKAVPMLHRIRVFWTNVCCNHDKIFSSVGLSYLSKVKPRNLVHTVRASRCKTGLAVYHICHLYKTSGPLFNEKYNILKALNCWARLRKDITSTTTDILSSPPKGVLFDEE